jgi:predicted PurR-regulated permease PerM
MLVERDMVFWVAALAIVVVLLWLLGPILLPFVLGMAIAYALDPLANQLSKRGAGRLLAASLILGGFVVALALLVLLIAPVLVGSITHRLMRCGCRVLSAIPTIPGSSVSLETV